MKLTSEICFQAACNAGSVSTKTLENICAYAYNKMAQEEKELKQKQEHNYEIYSQN